MEYIWKCVEQCSRGTKNKVKNLDNNINKYCIVVGLALFLQHFYIFADFFTFHSQPAAHWFSTSSDAALVKTFIWFGGAMNGHLSCGVAADGAAIFIESKAVVGGVWLSFAAKNRSGSIGHREGRTLQDHSTIFKTERRLFLPDTPKPSFSSNNPKCSFKALSITTRFQCCVTYQWWWCWCRCSSPRVQTDTSTPRCRMGRFF